MTWTFKCYGIPGNNCPLKAWHDDLSPRARAKFKTTREFLEQNPSHQWKRPHYAPLHGPCAGFGEIRFKADGVQHRVLGYFQPDSVFVLVIGTIEKGDKLPRNICDTANQRKKIIEENEEYAHGCDFDD